MKKIIFLILLTSSLFAKNLDLDFNKQSSLAGSWTEVVSVIAENFTPYEIERCMVIKSFFIDIGEYRNCCLDGESCLESNRFDEMPKLILSGRFQLAGQWRSNISFDRLKINVDSDRPVIVHFKNSTDEVIALVQGYEKNGDLYMIDPIHGATIKTSFKDLKEKGFNGINWISSYTIGY